MRKGQVQASLHIHAVSPEPLLFSSKCFYRLSSQRIKDVALLWGWILCTLGNRLYMSEGLFSHVVAQLKHSKTHRGHADFYVQEKRLFVHAKSKTQIRCAVTAQLIAQLICVFVFAAQIVQFLFFLLNYDILNFKPSSVATQVSLCQTGSEILKTIFSCCS